MKGKRAPKKGLYTDGTNRGPGELLQKTVELLKNSELTYLEIYRQTSLAPPWLRLLEMGKIQNPSVNYIEILYLFLTGKKSLL